VPNGMHAQGHSQVHEMLETGPRLGLGGYKRYAWFSLFKMTNMILKIKLIEV
jgi:hypothetical protein